MARQNQHIGPATHLVSAHPDDNRMKAVRDKSTKCRICPDPMIGLVGIAMAEVATALGALGEAVVF
jgi:hypothetical protein